MSNTALDIYDDMPTYMKQYISNYGWHFNRTAFEYAVDLMKDKNGKLTPYTKQEVDKLLSKYNVTLDNKIMYDYVFVANMCKADYLGSSIKTEEQLALYIKDTVDDVDAAKDTTFRRWTATMIGNGMPIDWEELC